ncbi:hypothetical protein Phi14:2_gp011 [Cellulophaga phage phi14:2]|uniref:Uncharacterized protein n=1 Tax=Cellulophaga phage phi14:2 TaxID=1327990 RepID=R9ZZY0_9CAUD|nr:hypothetical protein Phi14:2_gp011 [Cellulophaga phage phi14:2]
MYKQEEKQPQSQTFLERITQEFLVDEINENVHMFI